jgi:hypothetical protein
LNVLTSPEFFCCTEFFPKAPSRQKDRHGQAYETTAKLATGKLTGEELVAIRNADILLDLKWAQLTCIIAPINFPSKNAKRNSNKKFWRKLRA